MEDFFVVYDKVVILIVFVINFFDEVFLFVIFVGLFVVLVVMFILVYFIFWCYFMFVGGWGVILFVYLIINRFVV